MCIPLTIFKRQHKSRSNEQNNSSSSPSNNLNNTPANPPTTEQKTMASQGSPKIAIIIYSMYGHIRKLAEAEKEGIEKAGGTADLFQ